MVKLINNVVATTPIDNRLVGKVYTGANTEIPARIIKLFTYTCFGVAEQLEEEGLLNKSITLVNCIFTEYGSVTLELESEQFANVMGLIVYPIKKWEDYNLSDLHILLCMAEELCHYFWGISDEVEVNYKVLAVLRKVLPEKDIKMEDLYSLDWMNDQQKK